MTTSEFIAMLLAADPDGTAHVRMAGGIPQFAELKPGYYDGAYTYMDGDTYVRSTKGQKVDIYTVGVTDIVWEEEGDMAAIRGRIRLEDNRSPDHPLTEEFWRRIEMKAEHCRRYCHKSNAEFTARLLKLIQEHEIDYFHYTEESWQWAGFNEAGEQVHGQLCGGEIDRIVDPDGMFILTEQGDGWRRYRLKSADPSDKPSNEPSGP